MRILRELQGLSQNQLAELSGMPQATLSAIEERSVFALVLSARKFWRGRYVAIPRY